MTAAARDGALLLECYSFALEEVDILVVDYMAF